MQPRNLDNLLTYVQNKKTIFKLNFIIKNILKSILRLFINVSSLGGNGGLNPWPEPLAKIPDAGHGDIVPHICHGGPDWDVVGHKTLLEHMSKLKNQVD